MEDKMEYNEYREIVLSTIIKEYPAYLQKNILDIFVNKKLVITKKNMLNKEKYSKDVLDLTALPDIKAKLLVAMSQCEKALKVIEEYEFKKAYRYCAIFKYAGDLNSNLENIIKNGNAFRYDNDIKSYDTLDFVFRIPTIMEDEEQIILKFSLHKQGKEDNDEENNNIKYSLLAVFFKKYNTLEIRFDTLRLMFKNSESFYIDLVKAAKAWITSFLKINLISVNFKSVEKYIEANKNDVILYAQALKTDSGSKVVLDIDADEECILPILGGLKNLMSEHEDEFNNSPKIKSILNDFIQEIKDTSDSEWCKLYWKDKFDSDGILITINHSYRQEDFSLIQYHKKLKDKERMNYVTEYLIECKNEVDSTD
jgi:hypothetical protein